MDKPISEKGLVIAESRRRILGQVMTDKLPFTDFNSSTQMIVTVIQEEVPLPREEGQPVHIIALCSLMERCWSFEPKARPSIPSCCTELERMVSFVFPPLSVC